MNSTNNVVTESFKSAKKISYNAEVEMRTLINSQSQKITEINCVVYLGAAKVSGVVKGKKVLLFKGQESKKGHPKLTYHRASLLLLFFFFIGPVLVRVFYLNLFFIYLFFVL